MLKVVGASWLQTRISTYILLFVALLGLGALIIGEYGHKTKKDGTYAATVSWNHRGGYRIDFWGQGNDLKTVPLRAARAYYKTGIYESGWSIIEIETSAKFPDTVQAYAAGLLEGSLTWQLIHHHWDNTVNVFCQKQPIECTTIKQYLRDNKETIFERAELLESTDPFWHMVRLFYSQLNGLETGWKFAVRRSRQSVEMETEDFLWLALAANLPNLNTIWNVNSSNIVNNGMVFLKALERVDEAPLIAIGHNTAAPYVKMLRLLKRYKFHYHLLPASKTAALIPAQSLVMSSYPGALSSHDEFYLIQEKNRELVVASTPLYLTNRSLWNLVIPKDQVMSAVRVMAANRLATDGRSWSRTLAFQNSATLLPRQWVTYEPRTSKVWLTEQSSGITHAADYTKEFLEAGFLLCTGSPHFPELQETVQLTRMNHNEDGKNDTSIIPEASKDLKKFHITRMHKNLTTMEHVRRLMRGYSQEVPATVKNNNDNSDNSTISIDDDNINNKTNNSIEIQYSIPLADDISQILSHRGDLTNVPSPVGVIDTKIIVADVDGLETFEATSGPVVSTKYGPFVWSKTFPDIQHIGHPDSFNFGSVTPLWVWK